MDKITPSFQETGVTTKVAESVSSWFETESITAELNQNQIGWMLAQGWVIGSTREITRTYGSTAITTTEYTLYRRSVSPQDVLADLVASYTSAYNDGRTLNDQRYDDLIVLWSAVLDKSEDSFNNLEAGDETYETLIGSLVSGIDTDFDTYAADVDGDLDDWGTDLLAEINARFAAELSKAQQSLVDRGLYSSTMWTTISAGIERERTRALNNANDTIEQRQLELKHKVYAEEVSVASRVLAARDRLRTFLHAAKDRQVAIRNSVVDALARLVEGRTDSYPDIAEIGRLATALGAGQPESYSP